MKTLIFVGFLEPGTKPGTLNFQKPFQIWVGKHYPKHEKELTNDRRLKAHYDPEKSVLECFAIILNADT